MRLIHKMIFTLAFLIGVGALLYGPSSVAAETASISASSMSVTLCSDSASVILTGTSSGFSGTRDYRWDLDGNGTYETITSVNSTTNTQTKTFSATGSYTIGLLVYKNSGSQATATPIGITVSADAAPTVSITSSNTGTVCVAKNFTCTATDNGTVSTYAWSFPGATPSTSAVQNPSGIVLPSSNFTASLIVTDNCGSTTTATQAITLAATASPTATITAPVITTEAATISIAFTGTGADTDGSISSYNWNFGDGNMGSGASTSHAYTSQNTYTVILTVTDNCGGTGTAQIAMTITAPPASPPVAEAAGPYSALPNAPIAFNGSGSYDPDNPPNCTGCSYLWDFGDGQTATSLNPSHTYATQDSFRVILTVTDSNSEIDRDTTYAKVGLVAEANGPYSGVVGNVIVFSGAGSSTGTGITYSWNFRDSTALSTQQNPSHAYADTGTYVAKLTVSDALNNTAVDSAVVTVADLCNNDSQTNCPRFTEAVYTWPVGETVNIYEYLAKDQNCVGSDTPCQNAREITYSGGFHTSSSGWGASSTADVTFVTADIGVHSIEISLNGVWKDCATIIITGDSTAVVEPETPEEVCGYADLYFNNQDIYTGGNGMTTAQADVANWQGDEDGDGLSNCNDPDCYGYIHMYRSGSTTVQDVANANGQNCPYYPGFASFYEDQMDAWLTMTNINLINFINDTLTATFPKCLGEPCYLPSGQLIPNYPVGYLATLVYVQRASDVVLDRVRDWQTVLVDSVPWNVVACQTICPSSNQRNFQVCLECNGVETTLIVQGTDINDALSNVDTNGPDADCPDMSVVDDTGPCEQFDVVLIPVIDVLRDPPNEADPYLIWLTDKRADEFTANFANSLKGKYADGGDMADGESIIAAPFQPGIRIHNADSLRTALRNAVVRSGVGGADSKEGLTIVSEAPVYIQGPYNTQGADFTDLASGLHAQRVRAAVIGDAVTILSSAWADSNSTVSTRIAATTGYNFALLSGNVEDGTLEPVERLVRYMEDWSGATHYWRTSLVNLFRSDYMADHPESANDWSSDPVRKWWFDIRFLDLEKGLPPGTPRVSMDQPLNKTYDRASDW